MKLGLKDPFGHPRDYLNFKYVDESDIDVIENNLYPWQQTLLQVHEMKPSVRIFYWIYDPMGNSGKSTFAKWFGQRRGAFLFSWSRRADLCSARGANMFTKTMIIDLTRGEAKDVDHTDFLGGLEEIKAGKVPITKYNSRTAYGPVSHLFIFSNLLPIRGRLSKDRYTVFRIGSVSKKLYAMSRSQEYAFYTDEIQQKRAMLEESQQLNSDNNPVKIKTFVQYFHEHYEPSQELLDKYGD